VRPVRCEALCALAHKARARQPSLRFVPCWEETILGARQNNLISACRRGRHGQCDPFPPTSTSSPWDNPRECHARDTCCCGTRTRGKGGGPYTYGNDSKRPVRRQPQRPRKVISCKRSTPTVSKPQARLRSQSSASHGATGTPRKAQRNAQRLPC
jgi:hypothetical protein